MPTPFIDSDTLAAVANLYVRNRWPGQGVMVIELNNTGFVVFGGPITTPTTVAWWAGVRSCVEFSAPGLAAGPAPVIKF